METTLRTPAGLMELARKFRDDAGATSMAEYAKIMNRTAEELEEMARYLETDADRWQAPDRTARSRAGAGR